MKLINELLGFAVLASPLFLIVLWVPVCLWLAVLVSRKLLKTAKTGVRITVGVLVFAIVLAVPVGDEIAGRLYFNHLCETEAGAKVYQTIELPTEYWDEEGRAKFYDPVNGNFYLDWNDFVDAKMTKTKRLFNILEMRSELKNKNSDDLVSEKIWFGFAGGWLMNNFSTSETSLSCGRSVSRTLSEYSKMFKQSKFSEKVNNDHSR